MQSLQNDTVIGSHNTSVTGGMEQERSTETSNITSAQQQQNKTGGREMGNETNQTGGNETQKGPLEQLGDIRWDFRWGKSISIDL